MKILRESSENEMILEYLKAESTSSRFLEQMKNTIEKLGFDENIVFSANLKMRSKILSEKSCSENFGDMEKEGNYLKIFQPNLRNGAYAVFQDPI